MAQSAEDPTIKRIVVQSSALSPDDQSGGSTKRARKTKSKGITQKIVKQGGGSEEEQVPGPVPAPAAAPVPASAPAVVATPAPTPTPAPIPTPTNTSGKATSGGGPPIKVLLAPKKKQTNVLLAAPKAQGPHKPSNKTRKVARRIRMSTTGLGKKLHRAKTIRQDAKDTSLEGIKKILIKAALIKSDSKAPEPVLRQIYADYMMLKKKAL